MAAKINPQHGLAAVRTWKEAESASRQTLPRQVLATATRYILQLIEADFPGNSVELRVPPFAAVQCLAGVKHRRGTPPAVVEMNAQTLLQLATGELNWQAAAEPGGGVSASGERSDLSEIFPLPLNLRNT